MPFVKVDTSLRKNVRLQRISRSAEVTYRRSQELAEDLAYDGTEPIGALSHVVLGALSMSEIALQLCMPEREVVAASKELISAGLWSQLLDGSVFLPRFAQKTAVGDPTAAKRQQRRRETARDRARDVTVSHGVTSRDSHGDVTGGVTPPEEQKNRSTVTSVTEQALNWRDELDLELEAIRPLEIQALTPDQRVTLGRYHAWRFANCSKSEPANRKTGAKIAGAFATMATVFELSDLSVAEYVLVAERFFAASGGAPWFTPFDVKAMLPREILERRNGFAKR